MAAVTTAVLQKPSRQAHGTAAAKPWKFRREDHAYDPSFRYEENLGDLDKAHLMQMLAVNGVQPNEQAVLASKLIDAYDRDGDGELNEQEQVAFKSDVRCGTGPCDIMLDANDQVARPSVVMQDIAARARSRLQRKRSYQGLLCVLLHLAVYIAILVLQRRPSEAFAIEWAMKNALFSHADISIRIGVQQHPRCGAGHALQPLSGRGRQHLRFQEDACVTLR